MKKTLSIVFVILVIVLVLSACAKQSVTPTPAPKLEMRIAKVVIDYDALKEFMEKWPVISNEKQARALGLHHVIMTKPLWVCNMLNKQKENPYQLEQLPVGTGVWADGNEIPRYKADCLNPIYVPTKRELVSVTTTPAPVVTPPAPVPVVKKSNFWAGLWGILKWILIALGALLLLLAIWFLPILPRIARWFCERFGHDKEDVTPITPASEPEVPTAPAAAPRLRVTPASVPVPPATKVVAKPAVTKPADPSRAWLIRAEESADKKIRVEVEGIKSFKVSAENNEVMVRASRR